MQIPGALFTPSSKNKKKTLKKFILFSKKKKFLYFGKWNFLALKLKNFLYFLKRKFFLYFGK